MNTTRAIRVAFVALLVVVVAHPHGLAQSQPTVATVAELRAKLSAFLSAPRFAHAHIGVQAVSLDTGLVLYETNALKLLKPASNNKLYTGALALDRLGPDFKITTSLYATAPVRLDGTIEGDLIVYGRGDPSFSARFNGGDYATVLTPVADAISAAGIKRIKGSLLGDESFFTGEPYGAGWVWDDFQYYYGAAVSALTVQDNVVDLLFQPATRRGAPCEFICQPTVHTLQFHNLTRSLAAGERGTITIERPVGSSEVVLSGGLALDAQVQPGAVAVHQPGPFFLALLKDTLERRGVKLNQSSVLPALNGARVVRPARSRQEFSHWTLIAEIPGHPISEQVEKMMKPSQNLIAQLLLLQVGKARELRLASTNGIIRPGTTTEDLGIAEMRDFLRAAGINPNEVLVEEGSGLSRGALLTPHATIQLLRHMDTHRHAGHFKKSLPIAGVDGSLRNRMKGTLAEKNVIAKTGSLRYVNSLSGYATTVAGERIVFSMMINNFSNPDPARPATRDLDEMAETMVGLKARSQ